MARYKWIIHVIEDLEKFAEIETLKHLQEQLKRARLAYDLDIQELRTYNHDADCENSAQRKF